MPATNQTSSAGPSAPPVCRSTVEGTMKMPDPITVPITMSSRSVKPSVRASVGGMFAFPV